MLSKLRGLFHRRPQKLFDKPVLPVAVPAPRPAWLKAETTPRTFRSVEEARCYMQDLERLYARVRGESEDL